MEENYFWAPSLLPIKSKNTDKLFFLFHVWDYNGEKMLMYLTDCENTWSQVGNLYCSFLYLNYLFQF
jgi:hypothetical protein